MFTCSFPLHFESIGKVSFCIHIVLVFYIKRKTFLKIFPNTHIHYFKKISKMIWNIFQNYSSLLQTFLMYPLMFLHHLFRSHVYIYTFHDVSFENFLFRYSFLHFYFIYMYIFSGWKIFKGAFPSLKYSLVEYYKN